MQKRKRGLAALLVLALLLSVLPVSALAAVGDSPLQEVVFNAGNAEITVGYDEGAENEVVYYLFDGDDFVIELYGDDNGQIVFPYGVQFQYNGQTEVHWFESEDETVTIGGHVFSLKCYDTVTYDENASREKTFTKELNEEWEAYLAGENGGDAGISLMSLLPLEETTKTVDLTGKLREEIKEITIGEILEAAGVTNIGAETAITYRKYDDSDDSTDNFIIGTTASTVDLTPEYYYRDYVYMELIVGTADALNSSNVRYILKINLCDLDNVLDFKAWNTEKQEISIYSTYYANYSSVDNHRYQLTVDPTNWTTGETYISMSLNSSYTGLDATVYEGYYETVEEIGDAKVITDQVWDKDTGTYLVDCSQYRNLPSFTVVLKRGDKVVQILPFDLYMYTSSISIGLQAMYDVQDYSERTQVASLSRSRNNTFIYTMDSTKYPANGKYYFAFSFYDPNPNSNGGENGINYVEKAVVGEYESLEAAAGQTDIKAQLFGNADKNGGYLADYSNGVTFTIFLTSAAGGGYRQYTIKTEDTQEATELPSAPTPLSADTYFRMYGAKKDNSYLNYYVMPYSDDSYYYNGYQTVFLLNSDGTAVADGTTISPVFWTGNKVEAYLSADETSSAVKQESGISTVSFSSGTALRYSAKAENGTNLKNYMVTFVTQQTGAKLFVNGTNDTSRYEDGMPVREVILDDTYDNHHDIFIANIGDTQLEGLSVTLEGAQNIALDEYWTVDDEGTTTLAAFTTTTTTKAHGELANVTKIRLVPATDENGNVQSGKISGTLVISSTNGGTVKIKLTGEARMPQITTTTIVDGVKYVPYSSVIQTNNMYADDAITFEVTSGTLPDGIVLKPNGELYGVPKVTGEFTFSVVAKYNGVTSDAKEFTLTILDNTNENVWNATDESYDLIEWVGSKTEDDVTSIIIKDSYAQDLFWTEGKFAYFVDFYLDGEKLEEGVDYTAEEGSTKITIAAQTFKNAGPGTHTIAAEFREGDQTTGTLKRAAQNYTINVTTNNTGSTTSGTITSTGGKTTNKQTTATTSTTAEQTTQTAMPFADVATTAWYYDDVQWAYDNGLMVGSSATVFAPDNAISQATILQVLARLSGVDLTAYTENPYEDIEDGKWYTAAAVWAKQAGLLPDNTAFSGEAVISREDMAIMLVKYLKRMGIETVTSELVVEFTDAAQMSEAGNAAFQTLYASGIFKGVGNGAMDPTGTTTRAQFSALIHRISNIMNDNA